MTAATPSALDVAHDEMLPLLRRLVELATEAHQTDQAAFFSAIARGIEHATDAEDLAEPFMGLSTSAFQGFAFAPATAVLLDQVLARAQQLSHTLSAESDVPT